MIKDCKHMKHFHSLLMLVVSVLMAACTSQPVRTIVVTNISNDYREQEAIRIPLHYLQMKAADFERLVLKDADGNEMAYQVVNYPEEALLFFATTKAQFSESYTLVKGKPAAVKPLVHARFVPERKDDFAWENDLAAYRMYGPALAPENPSNGVDLWLKCTDELIVDSFYYREHELHLPYHVNYGKGLDCYKVAHTPGCGGWFPLVGGKPQIGSQYDRWEILDEGPLSVTFALYYDHYPLADLDSAEAQVELHITCTAHEPLCKGEVCVQTITYRDQESFDRVQKERGSVEVQDLELGAGIFLHTGTSNPEIPLAGAPQFSAKGGYIAYAENAVADAGDAQGRNYAAVVMPRINRCLVEDNTLIAVSEEKHCMTYYFGGGWSMWKYPQDSDWFSQTSHSVNRIHQPSIWSITNN